jgi:LysM repeat protein
MKRGLAATALLLSAATAIGVWTLRSDPPTHIVEPGDSLWAIARDQGVALRDLRRWNDIDGRDIHPGDVLIVGEPAPSWLRRWRHGPSAPPQAHTDEVLRLQRDTRGTAAQRRSPDNARDGAEEPGRSYAPLVMPKPKPCLDPESGTQGGDAGLAVHRSAGLSADEIRSAVRSFQGETLRCADAHPEVTGRLLLGFTVGCDGQVRSIQVVDDGMEHPGFRACALRVLSHAPFPPHARDEVYFEIPLRWE